MKLKILIAIVILGIGAQFVPYGKDHTNPAVTGEPQWDSATTAQTFYRVCGNCHSNKTHWPLYSSIAPASWLIQHDVDEGRKHFNASEYDPQKPGKSMLAAEEVKAGEMPPWFYVIGHPEAKLSDTEKSEFAEGLARTFSPKTE